MARDPAVVSYTMSHIRSKNTGIEKTLRKALTEKGIRYRLYSSKVYGHPDIVLQRYRIAIFCDSEFWHGFHFEENKSKIKTNTSYWIPKIERNIARDEEVNRKLESQGYEVLRFWGNEIEKTLDQVVDKILLAIEKRKWIYDQIQSIRELTTLVYIEKENSYLMLHRVKKNRDLNQGKWIGVGGHIEKGETILDCVKREVKEETGLNLTKAKYLGKIHFLNDAYPPEVMYLYKGLSFDGNLIECNEGDLQWVKKNEILNLELWEGDRVFLPLLDSNLPRTFTLDLVYKKGKLVDIIGPYFPPKNKKKIKKKSKAKKAN